LIYSQELIIYNIILIFSFGLGKAGFPGVKNKRKRSKRRELSGKREEN